MSEPKQGLTRQRVILAAIAMADESGLDALSMRTLASRLDVGVMSVYHYVSNKEDLLEAMAASVLTGIERNDPSTTWRESIEKTALSARHALQRHPWAARLVLGSPVVQTLRLDYMESILGSLRRAGLSPSMADVAYHLLDSHILGFSMWKTSFPSDDNELSRLAAEVLETISTDVHPHVVEHIEHHLDSELLETPDPFEFGLRLILDGLERTLPASSVMD